MNFTTRLAAALLAGVVAAVIVAPFASALLWAAGFRFPFPRIFDRVVMVTVLGAVLWNARELKVVDLMRSGFGRDRNNFGRFLRGAGVAIGTVVFLLAVGVLFDPPSQARWTKALGRLPGYILSALAIAVIEEGFCRAFLLGGIERDFGRRWALWGSSIFYAVVHLIRAPSRFYLEGFHPAAGLLNLTHSFDQMADPAVAIPTFVGLLLLGLVLGEAFIFTGRVYFSMGFHAGLVLGVKLWPRLIRHRRLIPRWLLGGAHTPLVGGAAAWTAALVMLFYLEPLTGTRREGLGTRAGSQS